MLGLALALLAATPRLLVLPLDLDVGVSREGARALDDALAAELRRLARADVLTSNDLEKLLTHEERRQLLGACDASCQRRVGDLARAELLVSARVTRADARWLVSLSLLEVAGGRAVASADRRLEPGGVAGVLDLLPSMVAEVLETSGRARADARPSERPGDPPPAREERPYPDPGVRARLAWYGDGAGHVVALVPEGRYEGPIFAGTEAAVYAQRITGGGADERGFSAVFWEPRVRERWRGGLTMKEGKLTLQCGERAIALGALVGEARARAEKAELRDAPWRRQAHTIARDDRGEYYYVDEARGDGRRGGGDFRLFVGKKGRVRLLPLEDAAVDAGGGFFASPEGRLVLRAGRGGEASAVFAVGEVERPLVLLDLYAEAPMIYRELGAYRGQALGTACDPHLD